MSVQVEPPSVENSITPPSNACDGVAPDAGVNSNENLCENEIVRLPGPAVIGGDTRLASDVKLGSLPDIRPSSPVSRTCDHVAVPAVVVHAVPTASNVSVAELAGLSSVLSGAMIGTATFAQPLLDVTWTWRSLASIVVSLLSSDAVNVTVVLP